MEEEKERNSLLDRNVMTSPLCQGFQGFFGLWLDDLVDGWTSLLSKREREREEQKRRAGLERYEIDTVWFVGFPPVSFNSLSTETVISASNWGNSKKEARCSRWLH